MTYWFFNEALNRWTKFFGVTSIWRIVIRWIFIATSFWILLTRQVSDIPGHPCMLVVGRRFWPTFSLVKRIIEDHVVKITLLHKHLLLDVIWWWGMRQTLHYNQVGNSQQPQKNYLDPTHLCSEDENKLTFQFTFTFYIHTVNLVIIKWKKGFDFPLFFLAKFSFKIISSYSLLEVWIQI